MVISKKHPHPPKLTSILSPDLLAISLSFVFVIILSDQSNLSDKSD